MIPSFHAHVYYDAASRPAAEALREELGSRFEVRLGRWREEPVGPHPQAMYQVAFAGEHFAAVTQWLMLHRRGLTVLVHPETGDPRADHSDHALWMGQVLPLNLDGLG